MQVVLRLYDTIFTNNAIDEIFLNLTNRAVVIEDDATNFDNVVFFLPLTKDLTTGQGVKIFEEDGSNSILLFSGSVASIQPIVNESEQIQRVECKSEKYTLTKRQSLSSFTISNQPITTLLNTLISQYNGNGDAWTSEVTLLSPISVEVNTGDNWFDIIDEKVKELNGQRAIRDGKIIIKKFVGTDRTFGTNLFEVSSTRYDGNIENITFDVSGGDINVVVAKDNDTGIAIAPNPLPPKVTGVKTITVRKSDVSGLTRAAQQELARNQSQTIIYNVSLQQGAGNIDSGDKVRFRLEGVSSTYDYLGPIFVLKKTTSYQDATKKVTYGLGQVKRTNPDILSTINALQSSLTLLANS